MSADLCRRFEEHNRGESTFMKKGMPWKLIYYEAFVNKKDASVEELFLKTGQGRKRLSICLEETNKEVVASGGVG